MSRASLHIYAVNEALDARHTFLSRSKGEIATLPDLAGWLGLRQGGLNTDEIELFPTKDLAGMALTDYVTTAFDLETPPTGQTATRMNALDGHVLLIPDAALAGTAAPKEQLTLIANLPMAQADHSSQALEPASGYGTPSQDNIGWHQKQGKKKHGRSILALIGIVVVVIAASVIAKMTEQP